ncbi:hypothetical protein [Nocardia arthritidis]|uniref:Uncharacterized protein n=1 Tax=Nocardia arthritidis TaxID=228602 RepID=A0A6G9YAC1_9NOCA|nr:hypothetical protein [Nocardia arthritidis]QIS10027.1 hypothetical protein F5544_10650 [Nocardia arthritidis]
MNGLSQDNTDAEQQEIAFSLWDFIDELIAQKLRAPGDDVISRRGSNWRWPSKRFSAGFPGCGSIFRRASFVSGTTCWCTACTTCQ